MSARKSSHRTIFLIVSSGSPLALIASSLRSTSKKPLCPMTRSLHPPITACGHRVRFVGSWREEFFEVPSNVYRGSRLTYKITCVALISRLRHELFNETLVRWPPTGAVLDTDGSAQRTAAAIAYLGRHQPPLDSNSNWIKIGDNVNSSHPPRARGCTRRRIAGNSEEKTKDAKRPPASNARPLPDGDYRRPPPPKAADMSDIASEAAALKRWLFDVALPLWWK